LLTIRLANRNRKQIEKKFQALRLKDFSPLDDQKCVYLDYTGSGLASKELVEEDARLLHGA
jgi:hypothetical protein